MGANHCSQGRGLVALASKQLSCLSGMAVVHLCSFCRCIEREILPPRPSNHFSNGVWILPGLAVGDYLAGIPARAAFVTVCSLGGERAAVDKLLWFCVFRWVSHETLWLLEVPLREHRLKSFLGSVLVGSLALAEAPQLRGRSARATPPPIIGEIQVHVSSLHLLNNLLEIFLA